MLTISICYSEENSKDNTTDTLLLPIEVTEPIKEDIIIIEDPILSDDFYKVNSDNNDTTSFSDETEYYRELDEILKNSNLSPKKVDPFYNKDDIFRPALGDINISADKFTVYKDIYKAEGNVEANKDYYYIKASKLLYKGNIYANMEDVILTTCKNHDHPHVLVIAKRIETTDKNGIVTAKLYKIGIKIKGFSVLCLPYYSYTVNTNKTSQNLLIPIVFFSKSEGFKVSISPKLFENDRFYLDTKLKYSAKKDFSAKLYANMALDRPFGNNIYQQATMNDMRSNVTNTNRLSPYKNGLYNDAYKNAAKLTAKFGVTYKDKNATFDGKEVLVSKRYDTELKYVFTPFGKTKELNIFSVISPYVKLGYAQEKDEPVNNDYIPKYDIDVTVPYSFGKYKEINIQPLAKFNYTKYEDLSSYRAYSLGLDLSKYYKDKSFWNVRYIWAKELGKPLFEFDSVKYDQGLMLAGEKQINKKYFVGAWGAYNFDENQMYKYGILLGIKEDCFWTSVGYDFFDKEIFFNLNLLGF